MSDEVITDTQGNIERRMLSILLTSDKETKDLVIAIARAVELRLSYKFDSLENLIKQTNTSKNIESMAKGFVKGMKDDY